MKEEYFLVCGMLGNIPLLLFDRVTCLSGGAYKL